MLIRIHVQVFNTKTQQWKLRSNAQLENLYKRENNVQFVRSTRMQWARHAWRADGCLIKEVMTWKLVESISRGRPRRRRIYNIDEI